MPVGGGGEGCSERERRGDTDRESDTKTERERESGYETHRAGGRLREIK